MCYEIGVDLFNGYSALDGYGLWTRHHEMIFFEARILSSQGLPGVTPPFPGAKIITDASEVRPLRGN